jgi:holo-[acyl-carrier protein] synthase
MIIGIGTDIVSISRFSAILQRQGERFAKRILTDTEFNEFRNSHQQEHFLAKRFAAREAVAKAFGTGFTQGLSLKHIQITHDEQGKPMVALYDNAIEIKERLGINHIHISIADEKEFAIAYVIMEN